MTEDEVVGKEEDGGSPTASTISSASDESVSRETKMGCLYRGVVTYVELLDMYAADVQKLRE